MPTLTEEQRKELYDNLVAKKQGRRSPSEMGNIVGGITDALSGIATAEGRSRGFQAGQPGDVARQIGAAQERGEESKRDEWARLLKMDREKQETDYQRDRDVKADEFKQAGLDIQRERLEASKQKGPTAETKVFDFRQTPEGLVRVNRVTGEHELVQATTPKAPKERPQTAVQAKKAGQIEVGRAAEEQYQEAVESGEHDPTSYFELANYPITPQFMKSDEAIAAQAARDSWVETYLRDASGAAIPHDERAQYYEIYFPKKGDTPEVIANKERLRQVKEDALRTEAGVTTEPISPEVVEEPNEDNEALEWARSNPEDPRAKRILQLLGQ